MFGPRDEVLAKLMPVRQPAEVRPRILKPIPGAQVGAPVTGGAGVNP
jgi:hypothetical protein